MRTLVLLLLCTACSLFGAERELRPPAKKVAELFDWFDKLPLPDVHRCQWVQVSTGLSPFRIPGSHPDEVINAFLLKDSGDTFQVVTQDWATALFTKHGRPGDENYVGYKPRKFEDDMRQLVSRPETDIDIEEWQTLYHMQRLARLSQLFALARICDRRGHPELSRALIDRVAVWRKHSGPRSETVESQLHEEFASLLFGDAVRAMATDLSREELRSRFLRISELCPYASQDSRIERYGDRLGSIEEEDIRHEKMSDSDIATLPPAQRATELIFRLRDETGKGFNTSLYPAIEAPMQSNGSYSALVRMGYDAVPALLSALDTDSKVPTRSVMDAVQSGEGIDVETVADLAQRALFEIAGFTFDCLISNHVNRSDAFKKEIRSWWAQTSRNNEAAYFAAKLDDSQIDPLPVAELFAKRFPEEALKKARELATSAQDSGSRSELIRRLSGHSTPEYREFLCRQLRSDTDLRLRVAAACQLSPTDDPQALDLMKAEWTRFLSKTEASQPVDNEASVAPLTDYLSGSRDPEGILLVAKDYRRFPTNWRLDLIYSLGIRLGRDFEPNKLHPISDPALRSIEQVLINFLADNSPVSCTDLLFKTGTAFPDPRINDIAASYLARCWPAKYHFQPTLLVDRDRQHTEIHEIWTRNAEAALAPASSQPSLSPSATRPFTTKIGSIEWVGDSAKLAGAWKKKVEALQGGPFETKPLVALMPEFLARPPTGVAELSMTLGRCSGSDEVKITMKLKAGDTLKKTSPCTVRIAKNEFWTIHYGAVGGKYGLPPAWIDFAWVLDSVRRLDRDQFFVAYASIQPD